MKALFYSLDPQENYSKTLKSSKVFVIYALLVTVFAYVIMGLEYALIAFSILLVTQFFEIYCAKQMLLVTETTILEKAYKNGKVVKTILQIINISLLLMILSSEL